MQTTAADIARDVGMKDKRLRAVLRKLGQKAPYDPEKASIAARAWVAGRRSRRWRSAVAHGENAT